MATGKSGYNFTIAVEKINDNYDMKKENKSKTNLKSGIIAGVSGAVGSAAGFVGGDALASSVGSEGEDIYAEVVSDEDSPEDSSHASSVNISHDQPAHASPAQDASETRPDPNPSDMQAEPTPAPTEIAEPIPAEPSAEPGVEPESISDATVQAYDVIDNGDGTYMNVAVLSVNGNQAFVNDIDMDNIVDTLAVDSNGNGQIDPGEASDISAYGIEMPSPMDVLAQETGTSGDGEPVVVADPIDEPTPVDDGMTDYQIDNSFSGDSGFFDGDSGYDDQLLAQETYSGNGFGDDGNPDYINNANIDDFMV